MPAATLFARISESPANPLRFNVCGVPMLSRIDCEWATSTSCTFRGNKSFRGDSLPFSDSRIDCFIPWLATNHANCDLYHSQSISEKISSACDQRHGRKRFDCDIALLVLKTRSCVMFNRPGTCELEMRAEPKRIGYVKTHVVGACWLSLCRSSTTARSWTPRFRFAR